MSDDYLKSLIDGEMFQIVCGGAVAICVLTLHSGHQVMGYSPPIPAGGSQSLGCELAREYAMKRLEQLEAYRQAHERHEERKAAQV